MGRQHSTTRYRAEAKKRGFGAKMRLRHSRSRDRYTRNICTAPDPHSTIDPRSSRNPTPRPVSSTCALSALRAPRRRTVRYGTQSPTPMLAISPCMHKRNRPEAALRSDDRLRPPTPPTHVPPALSAKKCGRARRPAPRQPPVGSRPRPFCRFQACATPDP